MPLISEYLAADSSPDASADALAIINIGERGPGKHFPGPDFPLLKMGKVNLFDKLYIF